MPIIHKQGELLLRALVYVWAAHPRIVRVSDIAENCGVSISYMEQAVSKARKAGLIVSTRGPGGGYTRREKTVTVADVIAAIRKDENEASAAAATGVVDQLMAELEAQVNNALAGLSLDDLAALNGPEFPPEPPAPVIHQCFQPVKPKLMPRKGTPNSVFALGAGVE